MRPILYTLTSSLHGEMASDPRQEPFIRDIEAALGTPFDCRGADFSTFGRASSIIYIRTGGTEGLFLEKVAPLLTGSETSAASQPIRLLASGQSNSLAASMEILSWLRQRGIPGEILHGSPAAIAARIRSFNTDPTVPGANSPDSHPEPTKKGCPGAKWPESHPIPNGNAIPGANSPGFAPGSRKNSLPGAEEASFAPGSGKRILEGKRFGVIGRPSDWLISSGVDYAVARENLGAELIDIPIEELVAEARKDGMADHDVWGLKPLNAPKYGQKIDAADWNGAMAIYEALKALVARYRLDGLTLRCFDLLTALHNTGCLALARLNAEGITATCEGDIPAMLSMAVARALTGRSSFQVNLSRIEGDRLLFAHCTVPLDIVENYCYDTHFESGIGVAIHGILPEGPVTLFKLSPDCKRMFRREAKLVANPYGDNLCRTQVVIEAPGAAAYFLQEPIGNHHIIVPGKL